MSVISSHSNDCHSNDCHSNDCHSNDCHSNECIGWIRTRNLRISRRVVYHCATAAVRVTSFKTIRYEIYCLLTRLKDHNGKFGHFINNKWVHPEGRKSYETTSPATGQVLMPSNVFPCHWGRGKICRGQGQYSHFIFFITYEWAK